ncbi:Prolyl 3-hydroxylase OGFOD1 [Hondaea fermentalgiana]|uniref:Prolyl 3-hydroxylase OGFOD1 n=1 Tax=Hondaea fermentalgiana TaxID=2315210 RepID=A0A2R5G6J7_9STRA|nr:Prolyl 3-hydroxylase OGFOD1 [Hondaea fermentalgiana]|eukprot:GBG26666.1 Prolyl 3-hydroxylase OGFOD1 [Hondaea fermentalgiana]
MASETTGGDAKRRRVEKEGAAAGGAELLNLAWVGEDRSGLEALKTSFEDALPFPHASLDNFVKDEAVLEKLQEEIMKDELFFPKENDLFSFMQTKDLAEKRAERPGAIKDFVDALYSREMRDILTELTGVQGLTDHFDLTSSVYTETNNLLCHDDELSSRRIAYILYLVPEDWSEADGGTLDLFTVDANKQPNGIMKRIVPKRNSLVFFEVSDRSYHQVAEVLKDKPRHSIGGWFHGPPVTTPSDWKPCSPEFGAVDTSLKAPTPVAPLESEGDAAMLAEWVAPIYLEKSTQKSVREQFEAESCIELHDFFVADKAKELRKALTESPASSWRSLGPYQKRHFDVLEAPESGALLAQWGSLLRSKAFASLIADLTSLSVNTVVAQIRRFACGNYSLVHDRTAADKAAIKEELDVFWTMVDKDDAWESEDDPTGGQVVYAVEGEEEPLVTVIPRGNMLAMVYRSDADSQAFVKYVNKRAPSPRFDAWLTYQGEFADDEGDEEKEEVEAEAKATESEVAKAASDAETSA